MTSLVILIFLTHPEYKFSSVHSSFFSIGGGFLLTVDCENMIGVVDLRLMFLDKEASGISSPEDLALLEPIVGEAAESGLQASETLCLALLGFLDKESAVLGVSVVVEPLLLLMLLSTEAEALSLSEAEVELSLLDKGLGVLLRLLGFLDR